MSIDYARKYDILSAAVSGVIGRLNAHLEPADRRELTADEARAAMGEIRARLRNALRDVQQEGRR